MLTYDIKLFIYLTYDITLFYIEIHVSLRALGVLERLGVRGCYSRSLLTLIVGLVCAQ